MPTLGSDEGIVLVGLGLGDLRQMQFILWGEKSGFIVSMSGPMRPRVVKAGHYYLRSVITSDSSAMTWVPPQPERASSTFEVRAGSATYLGNFWAIAGEKRGTVDWKVKIYYRSEALLKAKEAYPWLEQFPLFVSKVGSSPLAVSWSAEKATEPITDTD
ncbi:MAG: hypothetical protein Q8N51_16405 [Gammaproteobacteria bacterium]|nr:hypothetical protein [Gammaproteobacteria bacterium]